LEYNSGAGTRYCKLVPMRPTVAHLAPSNTRYVFRVSASSARPHPACSGSQGLRLSHARVERHRSHAQPALQLQGHQGINFRSTSPLDLRAGADGGWGAWRFAHAGIWSRPNRGGARRAWRRTDPQSAKGVVTVQVILLEVDVDMTAVTQTLCTQVGLTLTVVRTIGEAIRLLERHRSCTLLIIDGTGGRTQDLEHWIRLVKQVSIPIHLIHTRQEMARSLATQARGPINSG
jgi:hypothetical protein